MLFVLQIEQCLLQLSQVSGLMGLQRALCPQSATFACCAARQVPIAIHVRLYAACYFTVTSFYVSQFSRMFAFV